MENRFFQYNKPSYRYISDSLFLTNFILQFNPKNMLLDVGCGCGIIGILISKNADINLSQIEIQNNMYKLAKKNNKLHNIKSNLYNIDYLNFTDDIKYDFIISNPPFFKQSSLKGNSETKNICRFSNYLPFENFIKKTKSLMKQNGNLIFCYDAKQFQQICKVMDSFNLTIEVVQFVYPTDKKDSNLVFIQAKLNSKSQIKFLPPLFVTENSKFTKQASSIYEKFNTISENITEADLS
jgi:tRNA1(Val) A37 N6-methylase TrmN6